MNCSHAKENLVCIDKDPLEGNNTHQCIGKGVFHCWRYGKIVDEKFVPDGVYEDKNTLTKRR